MLITGRERSRPKMLASQSGKQRSGSIPMERAGRPSGIPMTKPGLPPPPRAGATPAVAAHTPVDHSATVSDGLLTAPPRALPLWLVVLTFGCIAVFVAGLVVYWRAGGFQTWLSASAPRSPAATHATTASAPDARAPMLLVRKADGVPWFYTEPAPVVAAQFRAIFVKHEQPGAPTAPVIGVSYTQARSFAATRGGRLLTSAEWDAAAAAPTFGLPAGMHEWVDSPDARRLVARAKGVAITRADAAHPDVTFRVARDP